MKDAQRLSIGGRVQGVGYRPYIYRLAQSFHLTGWVRNNAGTVEIHAEGPTQSLNAFAQAIFSGPPPSARAHLLTRETVSSERRAVFSILSSVTDEGARPVSVPPDLATCGDCMAELHDPRAKRHRYPFINCTQCGPRYTIIRELPYDRSSTTLADFKLCADCSGQYSEPSDRRFHAQPLACGECGPALVWCAPNLGLAQPADALAAAVRALRAGNIVAVRGVGGYHLLCDAGRESAVQRLRQRKGRPTKPFAVMVPWEGVDGVAAARRIADFGSLESAALSSAARPIVVLTRGARSTLCASIAPHRHSVGVMLPYSPLHLLLLEDFGGPVVATSGNARGEPVLTDIEEAQTCLEFIADGFLHHNRPIARAAEDPVVRRMGAAMRPLRLGRGTAPLEIELPFRIDTPTLAVGAYQKSTIALAVGDRALVSPHLGDQTSPRGRAIFAQAIADLQKLYGIQAQRVIHDAHPQFPSTRWALNAGLPATAIWHHHAHASAVAGEFRTSRPMLCFTWDGLGLGPDQTLWGGEALLGSPGQWRRIASFRPFTLPGGDRAVLQPWRTALSLCWQIGVHWSAGDAVDETLLRHATEQGLNSPSTSSVGRLFDAAAALSEVCTVSSFEGDAPGRLEALCDSAAKQTPLALPMQRDGQGIWRSDWAPLVALMLDQTQSQAQRSRRFHASLAHALLAQALMVRNATRVNTVGLTGGVFQNRVLTEEALQLLAAEDFEVLVPKALPLNDAAISFGQLIEGNA